MTLIRKRIHYLIISILFFGVLLIKPNFIFAQNNLGKLTENTSFPNEYLSVTFIGNLTQKANIQRKQGNAVLYSKNNFGFQGGLNYTHNINNNYSIETGIHFGVVPYDIRFNLSKDKYILPWDSDFEHTSTEYDVIYYSVPVLLEYRKTINSNLFLLSKIGFNFRFYPTGVAQGGVSYMTDSVTSVEIFNLYLDIDPKEKPLLNYNIGVGILKVFKNYGALKFNIIYNLSFTEVIKGHYYFTNIGNYTEGTYTIKGSYVGIEIGYIFAKFKH